MKIASLAPSTTEILFELGIGDQIVASTIYCDFPEQAKKLPRIGSWVNIDIKKLKDLKSDLVLTSSAVQGEMTSRMLEEGLNVVNINPMTLEQVVESYLEIGRLVEAEKEAGRIAERFREEINQITTPPQAVRPLLDKEGSARREGWSSPKVYGEEWSTPPMVSGNWVPDIIKLAGGVPMIESGQLSRKISLEEIQKFNPQIVILNICGMGEKVDPKTVTKRLGWENLDAVKSNRIYVIDDSYLNRPTTRLLAGLEKLKNIIQMSSQT